MGLSELTASTVEGVGDLSIATGEASSGLTNACMSQNCPTRLVNVNGQKKSIPIVIREGDYAQMNVMQD